MAEVIGQADLNTSLLGTIVVQCYAMVTILDFCHISADMSWLLEGEGEGEGVC